MFSSVFGKDYASQQLNLLLNDVELYNNINDWMGASTYLDNGIIRFYGVHNNCLEDFIARKYKQGLCLHEAIHIILSRDEYETGIMQKFNGQEIGRGLNEGYTEWICKKAGVETSDSKEDNFYLTLEHFIEQIELAIGEEKTMRLGKDTKKDSYENLLGISFMEVVSLLMKGEPKLNKYEILFFSRWICCIL